MVGGSRLILEDLGSAAGLCTVTGLGVSSCSNVTCAEPEDADLDGEFPFSCGFLTGVIVTLALVVILRYLCSSRVEPAALRVRHGRLSHSEDVGTEGVGVAQSRISDRHVISP